jgi:SIR2-like domain
MARTIEIAGPDTDFSKSLARSFQSGRINFLIGSGASLPAIPIAGAIEQEIRLLYDIGDGTEARKRLYNFLRGVHEPTNKLIAETSDAAIDETVSNFRDYLGNIERILSSRRTALLPKQATIFSTNYDLFVEKASIALPTLTLNDGFSRVPSLDNRMRFSPRNFFNTIYNTGNVYNYRVEIPSVNLIKLHGSLSWARDNEELLYRVAIRVLLTSTSDDSDVQAFLEDHAIVLAQVKKFQTTVIESDYYELLRIYANELDRENALLIAFGFSFGDEHILAITRRALKNPTLRLLVFAYNEPARDTFLQLFEGHHNVEIIAPPTGGTITFNDFNAALGSFLPKLN